MLWHLLAGAVLLLHAAFVTFAVLGAFLTWRYRWIILAHLPALAWATWIELSGTICPLTPLENHFRERAGEAGYAGGFIEHYILPLLYPLGLTRVLQWDLAAVLIAINAVGYGALLLRWGRKSR
jgi:hypothetical protein